MDLDRELEAMLNSTARYGELRGRQAIADDKLKGAYALLHNRCPAKYKTVADRDAWVRVQPEYLEGIEEKNVCYAEWEAAKLKKELVFAALDKYRTDASTEREMIRAAT